MSGTDPQALRQWHEAAQWFAKADEDLRMVDLALAAEPPLVDPAAFHCQQAAEKVLKGLLIAAAQKIPRTHDLETLAAMAAPLFPKLQAAMAEIAPASVWLARTRYPDLSGLAGAELSEVKDMLASVRMFLETAVALSSQGT